MVEPVFKLSGWDVRIKEIDDNKIGFVSHIDKPAAAVFYMEPLKPFGGQETCVKTGKPSSLRTKIQK